MPQWRMTKKGPENHNWRGGRSVTEHGYVLLRVGKDHPLADVRGYAYEHRVVAAAKIGRPLRKGEVVHHIDGNRQNNDPSNVEVMSSTAHHALEHRDPASDSRLPGEANVETPCACGCGTTFPKFDRGGRRRKFIPGHNTMTRMRDPTTGRMT